MKDINREKLIFLRTGEQYWGIEGDVITTVLGSCVAICLWHPKLIIGGMNHIKLPGRRKKKRETYNLNYSDDAIWSMVDKIYYLNTSPEKYRVKVFGGSSMFIKSNTNLPSTGQMLVNNIINRLDNNGFTINFKHIGGKLTRKLYFDLSNGDVWLKKY